MTIDWNKTTETELRRGIRGLVNNLNENLPPRVIPQLPAARDWHCERSEAHSVGRAFRPSSFPRRRESRLDPGSESGVTTDRHEAGPTRLVVFPASLPPRKQDTRFLGERSRKVPPRSLRSPR